MLCVKNAFEEYVIIIQRFIILMILKNFRQIWETLVEIFVHKSLQLWFGTPTFMF